MMEDRGRQAMLTAVGISAGVATTVGLWLWRRRAARPSPAVAGPAQEVARAIREDEQLSARGIGVHSIAEGVLELTGRVRDRGEAERARNIAQATASVHTVVNRLTVEAEETAREETRRRWQEGAPDLRERQHYGMGVGMGTRRQSPSTDPDRPSDKQHRIARELEVGNVEREADLPVHEASGESRVEPEPLKPGDVRVIEEAGLSADGAPAEPQEEAGPEPVDEGEAERPAEGEEERG